MCGRCVPRVAWSLCGCTGLACVWMRYVRSGVCRVCLALPVSVARKGPPARMARMVGMVRLVLLALLVRRVPRV